MSKFLNWTRWLMSHYEQRGDIVSMVTRAELFSSLLVGVYFRMNWFVHTAALSFQDVCYFSFKRVCLHQWDHWYLVFRCLNLNLNFHCKKFMLVGCISKALPVLTAAPITGVLLLCWISNTLLVKQAVLFKNC